jgi:hypothetical protein
MLAKADAVEIPTIDSVIDIPRDVAVPRPHCAVWPLHKFDVRLIEAAMT